MGPHITSDIGGGGTLQGGGAYRFYTSQLAYARLE